MNLNKYIVAGCLIAFGCLAEMTDVLGLYNSGKAPLQAVIIGFIMTILLLWLPYYLIQKGRKIQKPF